MSDKKEQSIETPVLTKEILDSTPYHKLQETFKKHGVSKAWKPGVKAKDMIQKALELISIKKSLEAKGIKDIDVEAELVQAKREEQQKIKEQELVLAKEKQEQQAKLSLYEKILAMKLSREKIDDTLDTIQRRLNKSIPTHRDILLQKQRVLEKLKQEKVWEKY